MGKQISRAGRVVGMALIALLLFAGGAQAKGKGKADLNVRFADGPKAAVVGAKLKVTDSVRNLGKRKAPASKVAYFLSKDDEVSGKDIQLRGRRAVGKLASGARDKGNTMVRAPKNAKPGDYKLIACADDGDKIEELDERNNCQADEGKLELGSQSFTVTPSSFDYGDVATAASKVQTFTITNTSNAETFFDTGMSGNDLDDFSMLGTDCIEAAFPPGEFCTVAVSFTPNSTGSKSAQINVQSDAGPSTTVRLSGTGVTPEVQISPQFHYFGSSANTYTFKAENHQSSTAEMGTIAINGPISSTADFSVVDNHCTGHHVDAHDSCSFGIHFTPGSPGSKQAKVSIASNFATGYSEIAAFVND